MFFQAGKIDLSDRLGEVLEPLLSESEVGIGPLKKLEVVFVDPAVDLFFAIVFVDAPEGLFFELPVRFDGDRRLVFQHGKILFE